jgi:hypothetical protein
VRHVLSRSEMASGVRAALRSKKTPRHLRAALRSRLRELEGGRKVAPKKKSGRSGFLGWLDF